MIKDFKGLSLVSSIRDLNALFRLLQLQLGSAGVKNQPVEVRLGELFNTIF